MSRGGARGARLRLLYLGGQAARRATRNVLADVDIHVGPTVAAGT